MSRMYGVVALIDIIQCASMSLKVEKPEWNLIWASDDRSILKLGRRPLSSSPAPAGENGRIDYYENRHRRRRDLAWFSAADENPYGVMKGVTSQQRNAKMKRGHSAAFIEASNWRNAEPSGATPYASSNFTAIARRVIGIASFDAVESLYVWWFSGRGCRASF